MKDFYTNCAIRLIKLKAQNRQAQLDLDERRRQTESKKKVVDQLQLGYENLLYKEAYLKREIMACKDISTPHLNEVEQELEQQLATTTFSDNLKALNKEALDSLRKEEDARIVAQKDLKALNLKHEQVLKKLDRKRKFVDELPSKVETIKATANEVQAIFNVVMNEATK